MAKGIKNGEKGEKKTSVLKSKKTPSEILQPLGIAEEPPSKFLIVGIGASAGGLAAFEAFFSNIPTPPDIGMAFIVVQHLSPNHRALDGTRGA